MGAACVVIVGVRRGCCDHRGERAKASVSTLRHYAAPRLSTRSLSRTRSPQPFFYHFYLAGAPDGAASLGVRLASGLHEQSSPGCRIRLFRSLGASTEERAAALSCSAAVLAVLSPGAWSDPGFVSDLERAAARGLPVLFLYDPDPRMASHVELSACVASAPPGPVSALLRRSDVSALYRRWYEQDACLQHLMRSAGFGRCVHLPTDHDQFVFELHEARSDTASLQLMREGRWLYYEGQAGKSGRVCGRACGGLGPCGQWPRGQCGWERACRLLSGGFPSRGHGLWFCLTAHSRPSMPQRARATCGAGTSLRPGSSPS